MARTGKTLSLRNEVLKYLDEQLSKGEQQMALFSAITAIKYAESTETEPANRPAIAYRALFSTFNAAGIIPHSPEDREIVAALCLRVALNMEKIPEPEQIPEQELPLNEGSGI